MPGAAGLGSGLRSLEQTSSKPSEWNPLLLSYFPSHLCQVQGSYWVALGQE